MMHTPGPWRVRDTYTIDTADLSKTVAYASNQGVVFRKVDHEGAANAQLIAQAPAMLESLAWAVQVMEEWAILTEDENVRQGLQKAHAILKAARY